MRSKGQNVKVTVWQIRSDKHFRRYFFTCVWNAYLYVAQQHMETCRCLGRERWPMDHEVLLFLVLLSGTLCHRPYVHRPLHSDSFRVD